MKVVHNRIRSKRSALDLLEKAKAFEADGNLSKAEELYKEVLKRDDTIELAYDRLMIIYRKQKEYKKELALIRAGIRVFDDLHNAVTKTDISRKVAMLSKALSKSTGLTDKRGKQLFEREPVGRWNRRKQAVEKKLK